MKVAIAHDFLNVFGGAERVCLELSRIFPDAPIYTLFYNKKNMDKHFGNKEIITSSLQGKAKMLNYNHKVLMPFMARAVEEFDLKEFDVVISSQSAWMKGLITKPETVHVSYCHTPTRFLWTESHNYAKGIKGLLFARMLNKLRIWDRLAADRVDYWVANSKTTSDRIKKYYQQNSTVIYPPVDIDKFVVSDKKREDYFLIVSRLSGYKNVDIAVKAFNKLKLPLVIVGEGAEINNLKRIANNNIKFLGFLEDEKTIKLYQRARAFVFPTFNEDFGLTPVEAMACGTPVIAAGSGGSLETVKEGETGIFFYEKDKNSLVNAVEKFISIEDNFSSEAIRLHAENFSTNNFEKQIKDFIKESFRKGI